MPAARDPIGVLDSGLGGLSVLKALREELPNEQFLYCADCAHTPWGDKPESFIVERTRAIVHFLLQMQAKAVVLACNTATAAAADILRKELSIPIIGIGGQACRRSNPNRRHRRHRHPQNHGKRALSVTLKALCGQRQSGDRGRSRIDGVRGARRLQQRNHARTSSQIPDPHQRCRCGQTRARLYALPVSFRSNLGNHGPRSGTVGTGQTRGTCRTHATSKNRSVKPVLQRHFPLHLLCCRCRKTPSNA